MAVGESSMTWFHGSITTLTGAPGVSSKRIARGDTLALWRRRKRHRLKRSTASMRKCVSPSDMVACTWRKPFTQLSGRSIFFSLCEGPPSEWTVKPDGSMSKRVRRYVRMRSSSPWSFALKSMLVVPHSKASIFSKRSYFAARRAYELSSRENASKNTSSGCTVMTGSKR
jgi:hypothetical protein